MGDVVVCIKRPDERGASSRYKEFDKTYLAHLVRKPFRAPPTTLVATAPWTDSLTKPDSGTGGHFLQLRRGELVPEGWVVQPRIRGVEFRVSVTAQGWCGLSKLCARRHGVSVWQGFHEVERLPIVRAARCLLI